MNKKVGIERCSSYNADEVYTALKRAVELTDDFDAAGKTVLLKPNILSDAAPDKAITTHPVFLEAAIRLVMEKGASRVLVGDSPGLQPPGFTGKVCGLGEAARRNGAEWIDFTKEKIDLPCPDGKAAKKFTVTRAIQEADLIISLPKLKTHQLMYYTGAMKNLFGLIPSVAKSSFHVRFPSHDSFAAMIVDLSLAIKPVYAFLDAIIGMEGAGPAAGNPRQVGLVMASSNLLALDIAASTLIGYPPLEIPVNRDALSRKYWLSDINEIEYPSLTPADLQIRDYAKVPFKKSASQFFDFILPRPLRQLRDSAAPGPEINHALCVKCGDCSRICASQAISLSEDSSTARDGKRYIIDYRRCIRCYCCHEICPKKAIEIAKRPKNR